MVSNDQNGTTITTTAFLMATPITTNVTAAEEALNASEFSTTTIIIVQSLILCFALLGNLILIVSISKTQSMRRSTTHKLVLNLAACDIIIVTFSIINHNLELAAGRFVLGEIGCRLIYPVSTYGVAAAVWSLLLICIDRFVATSYPFRHRSLKTKAKYGIAFVHVLAIVCVVPYSLHLTLKPDAAASEDVVNNVTLASNSKSNLTLNTTGSSRNIFINASLATKNESSLVSGSENVDLPQYCSETWSTDAGFVYTIFLFVIQYAAPLPIIIILYSLTWTTVKNQNADIIQNAEKRFRDSAIITNPPAFHVTEGAEHGGPEEPRCLEVSRNAEAQQSQHNVCLSAVNGLPSNSSSCFEISTNNETQAETGSNNIGSSTDNGTRLSSQSSLNTTFSVTGNNHHHRSEMSVGDKKTEMKIDEKTRSYSSSTMEFPTTYDSQIQYNNNNKNDSNQTVTLRKRSQNSDKTIETSLSLSVTSINDDTHRNRKPRPRSLLGSFRSTLSLFNFDDADHQQQQRYNSQIAIERHKQTVKLLKLFIKVVLVFAICMLPNHLTWLYQAFKNRAGESADDLGTIPVTIAYWLTYTNSVVNPIIYGTHPWFRRLYKNSVKELVNFLCTRIACMKRPVYENTKPPRRPVSALISTSFHGWSPENNRNRFSNNFSSTKTTRRSTTTEMTRTSSSKSQSFCSDNNGKNNIHNGGHQLQVPVIKFTVAENNEEFNFHGNDCGTREDV